MGRHAAGDSRGRAEGDQLEDLTIEPLRPVANALPTPGRALPSAGWSGREKRGDLVRLTPDRPSHHTTLSRRVMQWLSRMLAKRLRKRSPTSRRRIARMALNSGRLRTV